MGVPKNFHQTTNLPKMVEALNDLTFYDFEYKVVLTEEYNKKLREAEILGHFIDNDLNVVKRASDLELVCLKSFSAVDDQTAIRKLNEWLLGKKENNQFSDFEIVDFVTNSFKGKLEEKGLDKILSS